LAANLSQQSPVVEKPPAGGIPSTALASVASTTGSGGSGGSVAATAPANMGSGGSVPEAPAPRRVPAFTCPMCGKQKSQYFNRGCKHAGPCAQCMPCLESAPEVYPLCGICRKPATSLMVMHLS
jgi:hypothetical protein